MGEYWPAGSFCPIIGHPILNDDGTCPVCDILEDRGTPTPGYAMFVSEQAKLRELAGRYLRALLKPRRHHTYKVKMRLGVSADLSKKKID